MCAEIPEWIQFLGFMFGFFAITFFFVSIGMKMLPSEGSAYYSNNRRK